MERVQKAAVRVIMGSDYTSYKNDLRKLRLVTLEKRRESLCLKFAKKCIQSEKLKDLFPLQKSKHPMKKIYETKYKTKMVKTKRYKQFALPFMRKLLNEEHKLKNQNMKI